MQKITVMTEKTKNVIKVVCTVVIAALTALLTALGLSSCTATQALNNAIKFEYKLIRDSQTNTNSSLKITNEKKTDDYGN